MAIGDAGLVTLAPALRQRPALVILDLNGNPFGDEGLAALVAPSPPAGAPLPSIRGLTELRQLNLSQTQVTDAGCATIYSASDRVVRCRRLGDFTFLVEFSLEIWIPGIDDINCVYCTTLGFHVNCY